MAGGAVRAVSKRSRGTNGVRSSALWVTPQGSPLLSSQPVSKRSATPWSVSSQALNSDSKQVTDEVQVATLTQGGLDSPPQLCTMCTSPPAVAPPNDMQLPEVALVHLPVSSPSP